MPARRLVALAAVYLAGCVLPFAAASAEEYLPLDLGRRWIYFSQQGIEVREVIGTREIWNSPVSVIRHTESPINPDLENYWSTGTDGDVLLWGYFIERVDRGMLYDPPVPVVDAPLHLGRVWSHRFTAYQLPDTSFYGIFTISFEVLQEGSVQTPAGNFTACAVGQPAGMPLNGPTLCGRVLEGVGPQTATDWYCDGIGPVQYLGNVMYHLMSYDEPTPTEQTSWGAIRALYGPHSLPFPEHP